MSLDHPPQNTKVSVYKKLTVHCIRNFSKFVNDLIIILDTCLKNNQQNKLKVLATWFV